MEVSVGRLCNASKERCSEETTVAAFSIKEAIIKIRTRCWISRSRRKVWRKPCPKSFDVDLNQKAHSPPLGSMQTETGACLSHLWWEEAERWLFCRPKGKMHLPIRSDLFLWLRRTYPTKTITSALGLCVSLPRGLHWVNKAAAAVNACLHTSSLGMAF